MAIVVSGETMHAAVVNLTDQAFYCTPASA
jgi:hypothetical protein